MKIGVSSQNFRTITGHAGKGRRFFIYESASNGEVRELERLDLPKGMSLHDTLPSSPHPLEQLDVLVTRSGGSGFERKLAARGVKLVRTSASDPRQAAEALARGEKLPAAEQEPEDHQHGHHGGGHNPEHTGDAGGCGGGHEHRHHHGHTHRQGGGCGCNH